jgi:hypothetical protein
MGEGSELEQRRNSYTPVGRGLAAHSASQRWRTPRAAAHTSAFFTNGRVHHRRAGGRDCGGAGGGRGRVLPPVTAQPAIDEARGVTDGPATRVSRGRAGWPVQSSQLRRHLDGVGRPSYNFSAAVASLWQRRWLRSEVPVRFRAVESRSDDRFSTARVGRWIRQQGWRFSELR